jgi:PhnB protein
MPNAAKPIPEGFHTITAAITVRDAAAAIDFYKKAFGAVEISRMTGPDGKIGHAELRIGDSVLFLGDEWPGMSAVPSSGLPSSTLFMYVTDVDSTFNQAVASGAKSDMPVQNMFWGDRYGKLTDPFGHHWGLATHVEDVTPEEMKRRQAEFFKKAAAGQN